MRITLGNFKVRMGNDSVKEGNKDMVFETSLSCKLRLWDVRHVPDIHFNLISMANLDEGCISIFEKEPMKAYEGCLNHKCEVLFILQVEGQVFVVSL
ncbi:Retrovirus-related Pol polyprotein from transposon TNT 1-94 [Apostasia shenzhenica]|uniref:Retrovirus-related Pol polyprotein from transposon TNT 1-94 n=1 Tax=Apostasia shenzhenica TaxID=1088818 RepID=A0A2I0A5D9_9ASPA|nr:Retrovirus-related Pol polyprotein from transposon TNT 1-94 [Apostasia shenzhenica]